MDTSTANAILDDRTGVFGEIYIMTNEVTGKCYVGQTVSHRLNHGKYRPFGSRKRFDAHICEATRNTKPHACDCLDEAIREFGKEAFTYRVLHACPREELDHWERHYIAKHKTLHPDGYNLTLGGQNAWRVVQWTSQTLKNEPRGRGGRDGPHLESTKKLTSERLKALYATGVLTATWSNRAKRQHMAARLEKFADAAQLIDPTKDLSTYISERHTKGELFLWVRLGNHETSFYYRNGSDARQEALEFLQNLKLKNKTNIDDCNTTKLREHP